MTVMTTVLTTAVAVPLEIHGHGGGGLLEPLFGFAGLLLVLGMLLVAILLLRRYGLLPAGLTFGRRPSPEDHAREVLADRMDVSTEEFMERASVLNWTPGSHPTPPRKRFRRGS